MAYPSTEDANELGGAASSKVTFATTLGADFVGRSGSISSTMISIFLPPTRGMGSHRSRLVLIRLHGWVVPLEIQKGGLELITGVLTMGEKDGIKGLVLRVGVVANGVHDKAVQHLLPNREVDLSGFLLDIFQLREKFGHCPREGEIAEALKELLVVGSGGILEMVLKGLPLLLGSDDVGLQEDLLQLDVDGGIEVGPDPSGIPLVGGTLVQELLPVLLLLRSRISRKRGRRRSRGVWLRSIQETVQSLAGNKVQHLALPNRPVGGPVKVLERELTDGRGHSGACL